MSAIVVVVIVLVALTLRQSEVPTYAPTASVAPNTGGPILYTVDATAADRWQYFSLRTGAVIANPGSGDWDLGFRRYQVTTSGGARDLGVVAFDDVRTVPAAGYVAAEGGPDPTNPALTGWYDYGFFSHVLTPKPRVWAVRTADGRYAKLEFVGYYCPGSRPGCVTFRYVFPVVPAAG